MITCEKTATITCEKTAKITCEKTTKVTCGKTANINCEKTANINCEKIAKLNCEKTTTINYEPTQTKLGRNSQPAERLMEAMMSEISHDTSNDIEGEIFCITCKKPASTKYCRK